MSAREHQFPTYVQTLVTIFLSVVIFIGVFGNALVVIIYAKTKVLHTPINTIVVNLAISDILQSCNMVFIIISVYHGKWVLGNTMCQLNGFLTIGFIVTSLLNLFFISMNRYVMICNPAKKNWFSMRNVNIAISVTWLLPALIGIFPVFGWSVYEYQPGKLLCTITFGTDLSYTFTLMAIAIFFPFFGICFGYYNVFKTLRNNRRRINNMATVSSKNNEESKITSMLGIVIISFIIFYAPTTVSNFYEMANGLDYVLPRGLDLTATLLAMLNHANNPIIYGLMNRNFKNKFLVMLSIRKSIVMSHTTSNKKQVSAL